MPRFISTFESAIGRRRRSMIESLLRDGKPRTAAKIAIEVFICPRWAGAYLKHMHKHREVHIKKWFRPGSPMYLAGYGRDAPEPRSTTAAERTRAYYKRMKSDPEFRIKQQIKNQLRRNTPAWSGVKIRVLAGVAA